MGTPQWNLHAAVLASAIALAGMTPAAAVPAAAPNPPTVHPHVVQVQNSTIVRRERPQHDGVTWKKRRHHRDARREHARGHDGGAAKFRPRATPKYAYDAHGNYRIHDGDHRDGRNRSHRWDGKHKHGPRIYKLRGFGFQEPSPALKNVLTAVPD